MTPTSELRYVWRSEPTGWDLKTNAVVEARYIKVLQQKWVYINEQVIGSVTGPIVSASDWRDVPVVDEESK